jgi:hypothetical protein
VLFLPKRSNNNYHTHFVSLYENEILPFFLCIIIVLCMKILALFVGTRPLGRIQNALSPKTRQISESIREEVHWRGNFPVI